MNQRLPFSPLYAISIVLALAGLSDHGTAQAATTVFFDNSQTTNLVTSGATSDTISTEEYLFTFTRDKLFTGGIGLTNPIGRMIRIPWPDGLEAQAVTTGPALSKAKITISRQDRQPFAIAAFSAQLLANTAGAGGSFEIMPLLGGEDGLPNPLMYNATGNAGNTFSYNTPELTAFDTYVLTLYVDYALMSLNVVDASPPKPSLEIVRAGANLQLSWPTNATGYTLISATNVPANTWYPVTNTPAINGELFTVDITPAEPLRLFRLRK